MGTSVYVLLCLAAFAVTEPSSLVELEIVSFSVSTPSSENAKRKH